jgi:hypothetical protein
MFIEGWYLLVEFASSLSAAAVRLWHLAIAGANVFWVFLAIATLVSLNRLLLGVKARSAAHRRQRITLPDGLVRHVKKLQPHILSL